MSEQYVLVQYTTGIELLKQNLSSNPTFGCADRVLFRVCIVIRTQPPTSEVIFGSVPAGFVFIMRRAEEQVMQISTFVSKTGKALAKVRLFFRHAPAYFLGSERH